MSSQAEFGTTKSGVGSGLTLTDCAPLGNVSHAVIICVLISK